MPNKEMKDIMAEMEDYDNSAYSNIDHCLEAQVVDALKKDPNKIYAQHAAWNFCGYIWFDGKLWHDQVWVHGNPSHEFEHEDIMELISDVNYEYGHE